jgi:hypothetical protein
MRWASVALCAVIAGAIVWWQFSPPVHLPARPSSPLAVEAREPRARSFRAAEKSATGPLIHPDAAELARTLHSPEATVRDDLEILQTMIATYRRANGGANPGGGLNEEIVDKLRGRNAKQFAVMPTEHPAIDGSGRLLDRWGTPYFFHPVSGVVIEVRSAGPDRKLWTDDDVQLPDSSR